MMRWTLPLSECSDVSLVGGKALNLGRLIRAGFQVPAGFAITTDSYRACAPGGLIPDIRDSVIAAYRAMGSPHVAVRSSATAEDMANASMAGQYETFLNIHGEAALLEAVEKCWASLNSDRTRSYLAEHNIPVDSVAMAVVVQALVRADKASVLFTTNPQSGSSGEIVVDASYGLGESVVSGLVQPDSFVIDKGTGGVLRSTLGSKESQLVFGSEESSATSDALRGKFCLNSREIHQLWKLGAKLSEHFGSEQDAEWAIAGDQVFLLQSRAITTLDGLLQRNHLLAEIREELECAVLSGRGPWVRHNLSETLPHPTPLTWSVMGRFMSGAGGFGTLYREVGFNPSPSVMSEGFLDLIGGQIYMDLTRAPEMFFEGMPFRYDLELLKKNPDAAQGPPSVPTGHGQGQFQIARKLQSVNRRLTGLAKDFDSQFDTQIVPAFTAWVASEKKRDLMVLTPEEWNTCWSEREQRVMDEFAPQSLVPSMLTAMAFDQLRRFSEKAFWDDEPDEIINPLVVSMVPDSTLRAAQGLYDITTGKRSVGSWIEEFGHRAAEEFDLATPRWRERPQAVTELARNVAGDESPLARHEARIAQAQARVSELEKTLSPSEVEAFHTHLALARRYVRYREDGKFFLMLGFDLLRDLALEAGRRLDLGADVFFLTLSELRAAVASGFAPVSVIEKRKADRQIEASLILPPMIVHEAIQALGEPVSDESGDRLNAFSISRGVASGPTKIVVSPAEAGDLGVGYILVCPSTDPNWTPLFVRAAGLVIERGGTLSHGAVVAREMGLPAIVLDGATRILKQDELITVDANMGALIRKQFNETPKTPALSISDDSLLADVSSTIPARLTPPPAGLREAWGARLRNWFLWLWGIYLVAVFALPPAWLKNPSLAVLDTLFGH